MKLAILLLNLKVNSQKWKIQITSQLMEGNLDFLASYFS